MTRDKYVRHPDVSLVDTLAQHAGYYGRTWCYPSQAKLCELHAKRTGRRMSRRTLNRHLGALVAQGYIRRIRRHVRDKVLGLVLRSTVYILSGRAGRRIKRLIVAALRWSKLPTKSIDLFRVPHLAQHRNNITSVVTDGCG